MMSIDLDIALKKLHSLAYEDGDLGAEYWKSVAKLLVGASESQQRIEDLEAEIIVLKNRLKVAKKKPPRTPAE